MKLLTAEQMRELDRLTIEEYGIPGVVLMENAGVASYEVALEFLDDIDEPTTLVLCGPGNNGGDGYVVARHLLNAGVEVSVAHFGDLDAVKGDARTNMQIAMRMGIPIHANPVNEQLQFFVDGADLIVDAMLGTGSKGAARGLIADAIVIANSSLKPILSLDIPSGIDSDSGAIPGESILADATVTFGLGKVGLFSYPAAGRVGRLTIAGISIPVEAIESSDNAANLITRSHVLSILPVRNRDSHKGTYGHLGVVAGSTGMSGAAVLSAFGGLRIGTGLVTLYVPESINQIMEIKVIEAMSVPVPDGRKGTFEATTAKLVKDMINRKDAAVIGPGISRDEDTITFVRELVAATECPIVLDADGLYAVSRDLSVLKESKSDIIITPHPGEMAMLLGTTTSEIQSNRMEIAREFAVEYKIIVVLKGAGTVIAGPDGTVYINSTGCSGMSSGGMGDVLAGMIGGLLAQGVTPIDAAVAGVYIHGLAGMSASDKLGDAAMLASDLADNIGNVLQVISGAKEE